MARSLALASDQNAREAAQMALGGSGSALGACLNGFFVAAGHDPGVLFSPVHLLIGGLGAGSFAYDGRPRQPGKEAKRPRGFESGTDVPRAAQVAVPTSLAALSIACAFQPGTSLLAASRAGVTAAKAAGSKRRAELIDRVAGMGARFLSDPGLKRLLLQRFGPTEQGNWGTSDLIAPDGIQQTPAVLSKQLQGLPWGTDPEALSAGVNAHAAEHTDQVDPLGSLAAIIAVDSAGLFCALSYRSMPELVTLPEYEVAMPACAIPVMRGVTRVNPGTVLDSPAALFLEKDEAGQYAAVTAELGAGRAPLRLLRDKASKEVAAPQF